jgi:hypothetical protein
MLSLHVCIPSESAAADDDDDDDDDDEDMELNYLFYLDFALLDPFPGFLMSTLFPGQQVLQEWNNMRFFKLFSMFYRQKWETNLDLA